MTLLVLILPLLAQDEAPPKDAEVSVLQIKGSVEAKTPGKDGKWGKVDVGTRLKRGMMVQTGIKSAALLRFGESTKVLVRASTFAVINEAFVGKNTVTGEIRLDVGSLNVDADPKRDEKLDFKVSTPQGTASIRGTKLQIRSDDMGLMAYGEEGVTNLKTAYGWEYKLGERIKNLASSIASDIASMLEQALLGKMAGDNLKGGDRSWAVDAFNPVSDVNVIGHRFLPAGQWSVRQTGNQTNFGSSSFYAWQMRYSTDFTSFEKWDVTGLSPIATAVEVTQGQWQLMIHGRPIWVLQSVGAPQTPDWRLSTSRAPNFWQWNGVAWVKFD